ncbi:MAG: four helix bundle protein [Bacteroidaceae bacterium]|nr:four helix bundle protein [Bacteroidaceae bacterium]
MERPEDVKVTKSLKFAKRIVKLHKYLEGKGIEDMRSQISKSGTSIAANVAESVYAQSTADFISKLSIARKEANETRMWLETLRSGDYIDQKSFESIMYDCEEMLKILTSIIATLKKKQRDLGNHT